MYYLNNENFSKLKGYLMDNLENKIDILTLVNNNVKDNFVDLFSKISSGNALLFLGAGFSSDCVNISDNTPPTGKKLIELIEKIGGFDGEGDLKYASEYFIEKKGESALIELLKNQFILKKVNSNQIEICSLPWRRVYTTNYDNAVELAFRENNFNFDCINVEHEPMQYFKKKNICVHINGYIKDLSNSIPTTFKLTESSYVSPDSFLESKWIKSFKKDLEQCSAILFIGYSLYDIEIKKILFENSLFKSKTFFIVKEDSKRKLLHDLSYYGKVYNVGISNFVSKLSQNKPKINKEEFYLECFEKYELHFPSSLISDIEITNFLLHGNLDKLYINQIFTASKQMLPYLIIRKELNKILDLISQETNFLGILSDFGNGKTTLLHELAAKLTSDGKQVYMLCNFDGNFTQDIEKLSLLKDDIYLLIDDYENCPDIVKTLILINSSNLKVIVTTRSSNQHDFKEIWQKNINYKEIVIDILSYNEAIDFSEIIENTGLWGSFAGESDDKKIKKIIEDNHGQISHTLLNLLEAPQMFERIKVLTSKLFLNQQYQDTILAICLLEVLNQPLTYSNISEVALTNVIYDAKLLNNDDFKQLFPSVNSKIVSKSSLYARNMLKNHFSAIYTVNKLLDIAEKFQHLRNNSTVEAYIYKSLLKFSFIERVLPSTNKINMLIRYYEQLKSRIERLDKTPHFWLQYAMARIAIDDFHNAQNYLETAYAKIYEGYDTSYLDAQQSRLWLILAQKETQQDKSMDLFLKAHRLLSHLSDDQYKYRQVEVYSDFYHIKKNYLSKKNKDIFFSAVQEMIKKLEDLDRRTYFTETNRMAHCYEKLTKILTYK